MHFLSDHFWLELFGLLFGLLVSLEMIGDVAIVGDDKVIGGLVSDLIAKVFAEYFHHIPVNLFLHGSKLGLQLRLPIDLPAFNSFNFHIDPINCPHHPLNIATRQLLIPKIRNLPHCLHQSFPLFFFHLISLLHSFFSPTQHHHPLIPPKTLLQLIKILHNLINKPL